MNLFFALFLVQQFSQASRERGRRRETLPPALSAFCPVRPEPGSPAHQQLQGMETPRAQYPVGLSDDSPLIIPRICDWN